MDNIAWKLSNDINGNKYYYYPENENEFIADWKVSNGIVDMLRNKIKNRQKYCYD